MADSLIVSEKIKENRDKTQIDYALKALESLRGLSNSEVSNICFIMRDIYSDNSRSI